MRESGLGAYFFFVFLEGFFMIVSSIHGSQHLRVGTSISALALALALPLGIERYRCLLVGPAVVGHHRLYSCLPS